MDFSCAPILQFFSMAPEHSTKFLTAFFAKFFTTLRKDSGASCAWLWTVFTASVRGADVLCNALNSSPNCN